MTRALSAMGSSLAEARNEMHDSSALLIDNAKTFTATCAQQAKNDIIPVLDAIIEKIRSKSLDDAPPPSGSPDPFHYHSYPDVESFDGNSAVTHDDDGEPLDLPPRSPSCSTPPLC
eukprot:4217946-Alexandrium_andersonii.AAC.1